jgi:hypothetical protein
LQYQQNHGCLAVPRKQIGTGTEREERDDCGKQGGTSHGEVLIGESIERRSHFSFSFNDVLASRLTDSIQDTDGTTELHLVAVDCRQY